MTMSVLTDNHISPVFAIHNVLVFVLILSSFRSAASGVNVESRTSEESGSLVVPVGVVLDLNSPVGSMVELSMQMAVSDFYKSRLNYTTRLQLHVKNAQSLLDANFAVQELLEHEKVHGIIAPQGSAEATMFAELGQKVHVPVNSLASQSSAISHIENRDFMRITPDDAVQAQALAAVCQNFQWPEVAILYEDTDYGNQFLSCMNKALQEVEIRLAYMIAISTSANNSDILKELNRLSTKQTRVFIVHMKPSLGFRLFTLAKKAGIMSEGYAWLMSDSLSIFMNSMDSVGHDSMEGVLGIRPYITRSKELESFQERFKRNVTLKNTSGPIPELNVYGLWAYDAVTALATAVEKIVPLNFNLFDVNTTTNRSGVTNLRITAFGTRLLNEFSSTNFTGLSGEFQLVNGKLKVSAFEIFNVFGTGEKTVGFWTRERGIIRDWSSKGKTEELKSVLWPGDSVKQPRGWAIPATGNLRVGIP